MTIFYSRKKRKTVLMHINDFLKNSYSRLLKNYAQGSFSFQRDKKKSLVTYVESCYMGSNFEFTVRAPAKKKIIFQKTW